MISQDEAFLEQNMTAFRFITSGNYIACSEILETVKTSNKLLQLENQCGCKSDCMHCKCNYVVISALKQNFIISKYLVNIMNFSTVKLQNFTTQLQNEILKIQCKQPKEGHFIIEVACLYNYLIQNIVCMSKYQKVSTEVWSFILNTLQRVSEFTSKYYIIPTFLLLDIEVYLENIMYKKLSAVTLEMLYYCFFAIGWLASVEKKRTVHSAIVKAQSKIVYLLEKQSNFQENIELIFPANNSTKSYLLQLHNFIMSFSKYHDNELHKALYYLKKISCSEWAGFVTYMEAYIFYKKNDLSSAIETCLIAWKLIDTLPDKLIAKSCNLIACCYFIQNNFEEALKWLLEAVRLNERSSTYLLNLSQVQAKFNQPSKLINTFKQLINGKDSLFSKSADSIYSLSQEPKQKVLDIELRYLLARQYLLIGKYKEASVQFSKLIFDNRDLSVISDCNYEKKLIYLYRWHLEAAYVYMQMEQFYECEKFCIKADQQIPWCNYDVPFCIQNLRKGNRQHDKCYDVIGHETLQKTQELQCQLQIFEYELLDIIKLLIRSVLSLNCIDVNTAFSILRRASKLLCKLMKDKAAVCHEQEIQKTQKSDNYLHYKWENPDLIMRKEFVAQSNIVAGCTNVCKPNLSQSLGNQLNYQTNVPIPDASLILTKERCLYSHIFNNMALIAVIYGCFNTADNYFKLSVDADSDNLDVLFNYCLFELKRGNIEVADSLWKSFKKRNFVINDILSKKKTPFPYSVTMEQLETLDLVLSKDSNDENFMEFDVFWS